MKMHEINGVTPLTCMLQNTWGFVLLVICGFPGQPKINKNREQIERPGMLYGRMKSQKTTEAAESPSCHPPTPNACGGNRRGRGRTYPLRQQKTGQPARKAQEAI